MSVEREILTIAASDRGLILVGEIDASNTATLSSAPQSLPGTTDGIVEIDMNGVTFLDSSGLRTLVEFAQRVLLAGGSVTLVDTPSNVARLIEIAELHHLLELRSSSPP